MDWNGGSLRQPYNITRPDSSSFNFLYNNYNYDHYPGVDVKHQGMGEATTGMNNIIPGGMDHKMSYGSSCNDHKKKRLTTDQLESLESSFQEEIKLDPDRKMKLSRELGLQPRQIAVWFQNRRARWKAKQLERLYDALKQEFDTVSKEKHKLQEEVMKLKAVMREQGTKKQVSTGYTDISGEETVESTSVGAIWSTNKQQHQHPPRGIIGEGNYLLNADEYATVVPVSSPCWPLLPSYP